MSVPVPREVINYSISYKYLNYCMQIDSEEESRNAYQTCAPNSNLRTRVVWKTRYVFVKATRGKQNRNYRADRYFADLKFLRGKVKRFVKRHGVT